MASIKERGGKRAESRLKKTGFVEVLEAGIKTVAVSLESGGQTLRSSFERGWTGSWLDSALACDHPTETGRMWGAEPDLAIATQRMGINVDGEDMVPALTLPSWPVRSWASHGLSLGLFPHL